MRNPRNLNALSLALILVWSAGVCAQTRPQRSTTAPVANEEPETGAITGSVVNESGQGLAGVLVSVREINPVSSGRTVTTDADGNFRVSGLGPALYYVSASYPAYVVQPTETVFPFNYHRIGDSVRIEMIRGGVITGTVTNAMGEPVIGVRIRATMIRNGKGEPLRAGGPAFADRTTDDRGIYRLYGLPPGTYLISAGGTLASQPFFLNPYDTHVPTYSPSSTRDTATEVTLRGNEELNADIRYRGEIGHTISGTMRMVGNSNGTVTLTPAGSGMATANAFQMPGSSSFAFLGIADGEYEVVSIEIKSPAPAGGQQPNLWMSEPKRITVKGADVTGLELVTKPLAAFTGRIVLEPAKVPACEGKRRPSFAEMLLAVQRPEKEADKDNIPFFRWGPTAVSPEASGNFTLRNLAPGRYLFDPRFHARYWYLSSISIAATPRIDPAANWTTLKFGDQITNVTITLAEGAASIRGRLKPPENVEIPSGLGVYLVPADREKAADGLRHFVTAVEPGGAFSFNNLPPGRYLSVVQPLDEQSSTLTKLRRPEATEIRTKLRRVAEARKKELELKPCQNLTDVQLSTQ